MKKHFFLLACFLLLLPFGSCTQEDLLDGAAIQHTASEANLADEETETSVTHAQAMAVANHFLGRCSAQTRSEGEAAAVAEIKKGDEPLIYIINYHGGGFALISAKTTYYPVLAYSDKGRFEYIPQDTHPELKGWLEDRKKLISGECEVSVETKLAAQAQWTMYLDADPQTAEQPVLRATSTSTAQYAFLQRKHELGALGYNSLSLDKASSFASSYGVSIKDFESKADLYNSPRKYTIFAFQESSYNSGVGPKLTTEWGQGYPYNALSKADSTNDAGCVTIAMAQIMRCFQHPTTYNWNNMPDNTATQDTQELIRDIACGLGISYAGADNSATILDAKSVFTSSAFLYNVTMKNHAFNDVTNALNRNKLVFMSGVDSDKSEGHAWVCDGYKREHRSIKYFVEYLYGSEGNYEYKSPELPSIDGLGTADRNGNYYLHMNWGWNGQENGWFLEDNINNIYRNYNTSRKNLYVSPK